MAGKPFKKIDLNLLHTFLVLYQMRNTTRAADVLCLSQSAVSRALQRLRADFGDQLFISGRAGLIPTQRAERLAIELPDALSSLESICSEQTTFDPTQLDGNIRISGIPTALSAIVSQLSVTFNKQAPKLKLELTNWTSETKAQLLNGEVQLGIGLEMLNMPKELLQKRIGSDQFKFLARKNHPLIGQKVTPAELSQYPIGIYIIYNLNDTHSHVERQLQQEGVLLNVNFRTTQFEIMVNLVANSDTLFPASLMTHACYPDKWAPLEFDSPGMPVLNVILYYHVRHRNNPLYLWLEKQLRAILTPMLQ